MSSAIEETMPLHGTFKDGVVVLSGGVTLPEGTAVLVTLAQVQLREEFTFWNKAGAEAWQIIAKGEAEEGSDTEVQTRFGEYVDRAQQEPVSIKKNGRKYAVLLSQAEYERLQAAEDRYWDQMATEAKKTACLRRKRQWLF